MIRRIIKIDENKCDGCGLCATACHEGAIHIAAGKAKLTRDDYCDGLGDCLPACPKNAISFEEREALAYDEAAVLKAKADGSMNAGRFNQWPVQLKLVNPAADYFADADLLVAADCTAYAYGNFHRDFMKNRIVLIGCPKLDNIDYSEKLTQILARNVINSITLVRMSVPCCGGMAMAVEKALSNVSKNIPCTVRVIDTNGQLLS